MPQPYDLTNITNADNIYELSSAANGLTDGLFGVLFVFSVFIIIYSISAKWGFKPAFATAAYITAGVCVLVRIMNWIPDTIMFISFLLVAASYLIMKFS